MTFLTYVLATEFPGYRHALPAAIRARARARRGDLLAALRRVALAADDRKGACPAVEFRFAPGRLELSADCPLRGSSAREGLRVAYAGAPLTIGFNARYWLDALAVHGGDEIVEIGLTSTDGPALVRASGDPGHTYVVMPWRLPEET